MALVRRVHRSGTRLLDEFQKPPKHRPYSFARKEDRMTESAPIINFTADTTLIRPGECTTLRWHVEGVREVYFFAKGEGWRAMAS